MKLTFSPKFAPDGWDILARLAMNDDDELRPAVPDEVQRIVHALNHPEVNKVIVDALLRRPPAKEEKQ